MSAILDKGTIRRIASDVADIIKNPLEDNGIFYKHNEDNMLSGHALIIGPEDTPYFGGNYLFEFLFPSDYPFTPPKVIFRTGDGLTRFNPNLYKNGKVCLSVLNTWKGPQWSSCQSIRSILLTLVTVLNSNPLLNEPGIKNDNPDVKNYNEIIYFKNIEFTIIQYLLFPNTIPVENEEIKDIMKKKYLENKDKILEYILKNINLKKNINLLNIYDLKSYINYKFLLDKYNKLKLN